MGHARSRCWLCVLTDLILFKSTFLPTLRRLVSSGLFGPFYSHVTEQDFGLIQDLVRRDGVQGIGDSTFFVKLKMPESIFVACWV